MQRATGGCRNGRTCFVELHAHFVHHLEPMDHWASRIETMLQALPTMEGDVREIESLVLYKFNADDKFTHIKSARYRAL